MYSLVGGKKSLEIHSLFALLNVGIRFMYPTNMAAMTLHENTPYLAADHLSLRNCLHSLFRLGWTMILTY